MSFLPFSHKENYTLWTRQIRVNCLNACLKWFDDIQYRDMSQKAYIYIYLYWPYFLHTKGTYIDKNMIRWYSIERYEPKSLWFGDIQYRYMSQKAYDSVIFNIEIWVKSLWFGDIQYRDMSQKDYGRFCDMTLCSLVVLSDCPGGTLRYWGGAYARYQNLSLLPRNT